MFSYRFEQMSEYLPNLISLQFQQQSVHTFILGKKVFQVTFTYVSLARTVSGVSL